MTRFNIEIQDHAVRQALDRLAERAAAPAPALKAVGEALYRMTRRTFETSTDPWGRRWAPNRPSTLQGWLARKSGAFSKRDGRLTRKGAAHAMAKRPLIGEGRFLSAASLHYGVTGNVLTLGSAAVYAAIHQFGGRAGRGRKVAITARPFLPVTQSGGLAPRAAEAALAAIREFLDRAAGTK